MQGRSQIRGTWNCDERNTVIGIVKVASVRNDKITDRKCPSHEIREWEEPLTYVLRWLLCPCCIEAFQTHEIPIYCLLFSVPVLLLPCLEVFSCANESKQFPYFLFYRIQDIWSSVEILDPSGVLYRVIHIYLESSTRSHSVSPVCTFGFFVKNQVSVRMWNWGCKTKTI